MSPAPARRAIIACANPWHSPIRVGDHAIAADLVRRGFKVLFLSTPLSPFHLKNFRDPGTASRIETWRSGGRTDLAGQLVAYVPFASWPIQSKPFSSSSRLLRNWHRFTWPNVPDVVKRLGFRDPELLLVRDARQAFWCDEVDAEHVVYRVADRDDAFGISRDSLAFREREEYLCTKADLVCHSTPGLGEYAKERGAARTLLLPNGVNASRFAARQDRPPEYADRPVAIYVGSIDEWLDLGMIEGASALLPGVDFVIAGPDPRGRLGALARRPNVRAIGPVHPDGLPAYLQHASVGLIPFDTRTPEIAALVNEVQPLKLWEYFASGLPVVSTRWPAIEDLGSPATLVEGIEAFAAAVERAIEDPVDAAPLLALADQNDWTRRVDTLLEALDELP